MQVKTYKISDEAAQALEKMMETLKEKDPTASWQTAFDALTRDLALTGAATGANRAADARDFRLLADRLVDAYTASLAAITNAEDRAEIAAQDAAKEAAARLEELEKQIVLLKTENERLTDENYDLHEEIDAAKKERDEARQTANLAASAEKLRAYVESLQKPAAAARQREIPNNDWGLPDPASEEGKALMAEIEARDVAAEPPKKRSSRKKKN